MIFKCDFHYFKDKIFLLKEFIQEKISQIYPAAYIGRPY